MDIQTPSMAFLQARELIETLADDADKSDFREASPVCHAAL